MDNRYCIYRHLKPNGEVFYIGIGTKRRPGTRSDRNEFWWNIVNKYGYEIQILKEGMSREEACELECMLIYHYGRRDLGTGTLVNLTTGGEANKEVSELTRNKLRAIATGRKHTEETKKKLSEYFKGFSTGRLPTNAIKIIDAETNIIYDSVKEASEKLNINKSTLHAMLKGRLKNKTTLRYLSND